MLSEDSYKSLIAALDNLSKQVFAIMKVFDIVLPEERKPYSYWQQRQKLWLKEIEESLSVYREEVK